MRFDSKGNLLTDENGHEISGVEKIDKDSSIPPETRCYVATYMEAQNRFIAEMDGFNRVDLDWWQDWAQRCIERGHNELFADIRSDLHSHNLQNIRASGALRNLVSILATDSRFGYGSGDPGSAMALDRLVSARAEIYSELADYYRLANGIFWRMERDGRIEQWRANFRSLVEAWKARQDASKTIDTGAGC